MDDLISRQAAIDAIKTWGLIDGLAEGQAIEILSDEEKLPSAQPERLTDDDFETIRIHLNAYKEKLCNQHRWKEADEYQRIIDRFMAFASAQPDKDMIHLQKEQAYMQGWEEGRKALREEIWENERDRLD